MASRSDIGVALIWFVFLIIAAAAIFFGLQAALDAVSKVIVAVVTGAFGLMATVLTHALTKQRELEAEVRHWKQGDYAKVLEALAAYLRNPDANNDAFATAVLHAYVIGTPSVLSAIKRFREEATAANLDAVVLAMRRDIGLSWVPDLEVSTRGLFPEPAQKTVRSL